MVDCIYKFNLNAEYLISFGDYQLDYSFTEDVDLDSESNVYLFAHSGDILKFDPEGDLLLQWEPWNSEEHELDSANRMTIDGLDNIYVYLQDSTGNGYSETIVKFDTNGNLISSFVTGYTDTILDIYADDFGNLYVAHGSTIEIYDSSLNHTDTFIDEFLSFIDGGIHSTVDIETPDSGDTVYILDSDPAESATYVISKYTRNN